MRCATLLYAILFQVVFLLDVVYIMTSIKHWSCARRRVQFAPRPNDMSSVSIGMIDGKAIEADCGRADAVLDLALVAISSPPNNVTHTSSGLAHVASVNLNGVVGEPKWLIVMALML